MLVKPAEQLGGIILPRIVVKLQEKVWEREGRRYRTYHVTLPKTFVDSLRLAKGDRLEVRLEGKRVVYIPIREARPRRGRQTTLI
ncbi:MAG TPA: AbrB/MazE/SpoVT family DNA-binding domain-containing protein [Candidatus Korarchaeota archaeon]|nr:AbrB/MazE/SpoVT family DNA-binding domain-containing protein [Candidatus Korarchaeota archaeon]